MREKDEIVDDGGGFNTAQPEYVSLLRDLQVATSKCEEALQASNDRYEKLLGKYKALQSESTGETTAVPSIHKAVADGYILVVVDAHSHNFKENYLHGAESGGVEAAKLLKEAVASYLTGTHLETKNLQMIIRVYADLKTLSAFAAEQYAARKHGYKEPTFPRGLGAFAAGFSRNDVSVDYIDVADKGAVERKICGLFKMRVKDPRCHRIFFGASGSAKYVGTLSEHLMYAKKITLVQRGAEDTSLSNLDMESVTFAQVFDCLKRNAAISENMGSGTSSSGGYSEKDIKPLRRTASNTSRNLFTRKLRPLQQPSTPPVSYPQTHHKSILTNAAGHRIDIPIEPPSDAQWNAYISRTSKQKLCSWHHLSQGCSVESCTYDHRSITHDERHCLRYVLSGWPRRRGGNCRDIRCFMGHAYNRKTCKRSGNGCCKLPLQLHGIDPVVSEWIEPGQVTGETNETKSTKEEGKASMETWGATVGVLIDI